MSLPYSPDSPGMAGNGIARVLPTDVGLEFVEISGSTGTIADDAHGVECKQQQGVPTVRLVDVVLRSNALSGVHANTCVIDAIRSEFRANGIDGLQVIDLQAAWSF